MDQIIGYVLSEQAMEPCVPNIIEATSFTVRFRTRLQEMDEFNRNKRNYGSDIMLPALNSPYIQERLKTRTWFGEAGHPDTDDIKRQLKYNQRNLSHIVLGFETEGSVISGEVETTSTVVGRDMMGIIVDNKSLVAFSSRGYGPVVKEKGGAVRVKSPYTLFCYDWVIHPSHKNSYMENSRGTLVNESGNIGGSSVDFLSPISKEELKNIVTSCSGNLSEASDQLLINTGTAYLDLSPSCDCIHVKGSEGQRVSLMLEEKVTEEINSFLLSRL